MFPINDALGHAIIRASHNAEPASAAYFHSSLHPASMLLPSRRRPAARRETRLPLAAIVRQAMARVGTIVTPAEPAAPVCCPAVA